MSRSTNQASLPSPAQLPRSSTAPPSATSAEHQYNTRRARTVTQTVLSPQPESTDQVEPEQSESPVPSQVRVDSELPQAPPDDRFSDHSDEFSDGPQGQSSNRRLQKVFVLQPSPLSGLSRKDKRRYSPCKPFNRRRSPIPVPPAILRQLEQIQPVEEPPRYSPSLERVAIVHSVRRSTTKRPLVVPSPSTPSAIRQTGQCRRPYRR